MCEEKFYNQADARGEGGGGGRTGLQKVQTQITIVRGSPKRVFKGLLRYHKLHVTDCIAIYAFG